LKQTASCRGFQRFDAEKILGITRAIFTTQYSFLLGPSPPDALVFPGKLIFENPRRSRVFGENYLSGETPQCVLK
jgi:hypothetical protein